LNADRQVKLTILVSLCLLLAVITGLVLYALGQNISLFYTPTQVVSGVAPVNTLIRIGGFVVKGSVIHAKEDLSIQFRLTDHHKTVLVRYTGILPDLFREGQGIVTQGTLKNRQVFAAREVLAKHDAGYMPPELKGSLAGKQKT
jgi:cytochrome c-type biogenesis protein CcmE